MNRTRSRRHWRLATVSALAWTLGAANAAAETSIEALPADLAADLASIAFDDPPEELVKGIHYVASDESHHHVFQPHIRDRGGVFIGIGTNQNYTMLPWIRPEVAVMLDFDQMVVDMHHVYRVAFASAATPAAFSKLWRPGQRKQFRKLIRDFYADDAHRQRGALAAYNYSRHRVAKALAHNLETLRGSGVPTYLNDQAAYDFVAAMYRAGRIVAMRGDLTKEKTMGQLAAVLSKHGLVVRVYHPSNAEQYFEFGEQYRRNVRAMPVDDRSIVIRTRAWSRVESLSADEAAEMRAQLAAGALTLADDAPERQDPPKRKAIYYTYATQDYADFLKWLEAPRIRSVRQMLPYASRVEDAHYAIRPYRDGADSKSP